MWEGDREKEGERKVRVDFFIYLFFEINVFFRDFIYVRYYRKFWEVMSKNRNSV